MSDDEIIRLLDEETALAMPPETADVVRRARDVGPAAADALAAALDDGGWRALLALEAIRAADTAAYAALPAEQRAHIYTDALRDSGEFNAWGLPGVHLTGTARAIVALGTPAVAALAPLLDDDRPAPLEGSQDATTAAMYANRVQDYALVLLSAILGEPVTYGKDPAERDEQIAQLQAHLAN
jgi:hypothetical protein